MKHIAVIEKIPVKSGKNSVPDGAVNGNGDLGIILGNAPDGLRVYLSKCDLREARENGSGGLRPPGYIDIAIPPEKYRQYHVEQDMDKGELRCRFGSGENALRVTLRVCKTENSVLIETDPGTVPDPVLCLPEGELHGENGAYEKDGCRVIYRRFCDGELKYPTTVCAALKKVSGGIWYLFAATCHDTDSPEETAIKKAAEMTPEKCFALKEAHYKAWEVFYSRSSFTLSDRELENRWYASQYLIACCAGNPKFPPGLYGNFITTENPSWRSDYHLNYNYQAAFYAACSSNHAELTDCYHAPLEEFLPRGREFASKLGCRGILYPVGMESKGVCSELDLNNRFSFERLFLGQKSNALHAADIMVFRWNAEKDLGYAREHAFPYIREALRFFEDYAVFENGRYSVPKDAAHEVPYYRADFDPKKYKRVINDKNNALTLGLLRMCLKAGIEMSEKLNEDETEREKWRDMLAWISPYATCIRRFRRVFRYTEKGMRWNDGNDVGLQHIYPAGGVGLGSDKRLLKIARATFKQKDDCWTDGNAIPSYYPMAARLGVSPQKITAELKKLAARSEPDLLFDFGCGCIESCSVFANTLNEMALQSYEGIVRLFPVWDNGIDAQFRDLRADGAFLVSSSVKDGKVGKTEVLSEKGGELKITFPCSGWNITQNGKTVFSDKKIITLQTIPGEKLIFEKAQ